jgi:hypothetical protein
MEWRQKARKAAAASHKLTECKKMEWNGMEWNGLDLTNNNMRQAGNEMDGEGDLWIQARLLCHRS